VASNVKPVAEVVGDSGVLTEPNPRALAMGILKVLGDSDLRAGLEERGRMRFEEKYSFKAVAPQLERVIAAPSARES